MNIKSTNASELLNIFKWDVHSATKLMVSFALAITLAIFIVVNNNRGGPIIIFILLVGMGTLVSTVDEGDMARFEYGLGLIFRSLIITEILLVGIYLVQSPYITPIFSVTTNESRVTTNEDNEEVHTPYIKVTYYNADTNNVEGTRTMTNVDATPMFTNITGMRTVVDYFPFVVWDMRTTYIRSSD